MRGMYQTQVDGNARSPPTEITHLTRTTTILPNDTHQAINVDAVVESYLKLGWMTCLVL
jgi:hypothetical protein